MALHVSPVSRNLSNPVYFMGLEIEDMMVVGVVCVAALLGGQLFFADRYLFFIPMNWALMLIVLVLGRALTFDFQIREATRLHEGFNRLVYTAARLFGVRARRGISR